MINSVIDYKFYFDKSMSYEAYLEAFQKEIALGESVETHEYLPINWQRITRVFKTMTLLPEIKERLSALNDTRYWLVVSENWCGDAAQTLPVFEKIAEASSGKIKLGIVYRDSNLELIDAHLTNNSRSIPKLIVLDAQYNVINSWGARSEEAQALVVKLKSDPETASTYSEELHKWYAKDKQVAIQKALLELI
jgi:hypothetical protein